MMEQGWPSGRALARVGDEADHRGEGGRRSGGVG